MDCQTAFELLSAQLDGELSANEEAELNAHLEGCPKCQQRREQFGQLEQSLRALPLPEATPPAFHRPQPEAGTVLDLGEKRKPSRVPFWALTTAACLMFTVGLFAPQPQVPVRLYLQGDANLSPQRPTRDVCRVQTFRSGPIHGEMLAEGGTEFSLLLDAGESSIEPIHLEVHYDFDGDGQSDRIERYRTLALDDTPGWQEYHHRLGLESAQGEMLAFRGGTVSAILSGQTPVQVHQGASYIHVPHLASEG